MALLDEAQRNVNDLRRLFNANGLSIRDQNGELIKFDALLEDAAKLIGHAQRARQNQNRRDGRVVARMGCCSS